MSLPAAASAVCHVCRPLMLTRAPRRWLLVPHCIIASKSTLRRQQMPHVP